MFSEKWEVTVLCLVSLLASAGLFLRQNLFGYDSYAFLAFAKGYDVNPGLHETTYWILKLLPVNLLLYDVVMWFCLFVAILGLYFGLKQVFDFKTAFLATLGCLALSPIMIFSFAQFQNELFAYPLIFWSFYCLMAKFKYHNWVALAFALIACFFWLGSLAWIAIIACGLVLPFIFVMAISLPWWLITIINYVFGPFTKLGVSFETFFYGLWDLFLFFPIIFVVFWGKNRQYQVWMLLALLAIVFSARFTVLIVPFIGLGLGQLIGIAKRKGVLLDS